MNFKFYTVNSEYCKYLKTFDNKMPNIENEKSNRPFVGIVLEINSYKYYAPLTSPKKKHLKMKNQIDFLKINNGLWGAINFNNMIPVLKNDIKEIDFRILKDDNKAEKEYKNLLINQLRWCNSNNKRIKERAEKLHTFITSKNENESLRNRCCNFPVLEEACKKYKGENLVKLLLDRLVVEHDKQDRSGIYALTQRLLAYNSNKIEGSTLSEDQTASLFDTGTIKADGEIIRAKDVEEMTGHFAMFNEMLKTYKEPLSHKLIKTYHYKLKSGVFEDMANGYPVGEYKNRQNIVGTIITTEPSKVSEQMDSLIREYEAKGSHTLEDLAHFHAEYEKIHPFQDGNGRTGRIILFKECLKNSIIPFVILDSQKAEYYNALREAQVNSNITELNKFFEACQKDYIEYAKGYL